MTHKAKHDGCVWAGIALAAAALFLHVGYWIAGPVLLILLLCAYPQSYETGARELVIHDSLTRRRIPYDAMTSVARIRDRVRVRYGLGSQIVTAPEDPKAFLAALEGRAKHLTWRGGELVLRDRYVEFAFRPARGAWRVS